MSLQDAVIDGYDNPASVCTAACDTMKDAHLVGRAMAANALDRPTHVSGPKAGVFTVDNKRMVVIGAEPDSARVYVCEGSRPARPLPYPVLEIRRSA